MCQIKSEPLTDAVKRLLQNGKLEFYKVLKVTEKGLFSEFNNFKWQSGWNVAVGTVRTDGSIDTGAIHVFNKRLDADSWKDEDTVVVPVWIMPEDYIESGFMNGFGEDTSCFKKVYLDKQVYEESLKCALL